MSGIFVNFTGQDRPYFFSLGTPTVGAGPSLRLNDATLDFMRPQPCDFWERILDHRNGLLLYCDGDMLLYVCNPATRLWEVLSFNPAMPPWEEPSMYEEAYLVFDPTVSLHYEVLCFPGVSHQEFSIEWLPSEYTVQVFSSTTEEWEERVFVREGDATTVTVSDDSQSGPKRYAVYWRGNLYLHCRSGLIIRYMPITTKAKYNHLIHILCLSFLSLLLITFDNIYMSRFSLEEQTYIVIKPPDIVMMPDPHTYEYVLIRSIGVSMEIISSIFCLVLPIIINK
jgi:hypothetical protein